METAASIRPGDFVVLVVDDLPGNIQVVGGTLRNVGYQVVPATNGETALRLAQKPGIDLILLDLMMPGMDGFEVCRRLKASSATAGIPVIFLTADHEAEQVAKGLGMGAVDYVMKPFNASELLARVRTHLELRQARRQLEAAVGRLRELDREKNEFLGIAAHDLKNPVSSFIGIAQYILGKLRMDPEELKELATDVLTESRRLLALIQNLLDVNAIERGFLNLNLGPCDLGAVADSVLHNFQVKAAAKQQTLSLDRSAVASVIIADPSLLTQVLDNLVSNALKFSPPGTAVKLVVSAPAGGIRCAVHDQGPGISPEDQSKLFGKFTRLSARPTGGEGSTGLGLSIVKRLVESMNGKIWCESEVGKGSSFLVQFPPASPQIPPC